MTQMTLSVSDDTRARLLQTLSDLKAKRVLLAEDLKNAPRDDTMGDFSTAKAAVDAIDVQIANTNRRITALDTHIVISQAPNDEVAAGRIAICEDEDGKTIRYAIVHPEEADPTTGKISALSPIGRALIGLHIGSLATIKTPRGAIELEVVGVEIPA